MNSYNEHVTAVRLDWNALEGGSHYRIYRNGSIKTNILGDNNKYIDYWVEPGTYKYKITGYIPQNGGIYGSVDSNEIPITVIDGYCEE